MSAKVYGKLAGVLSQMGRIDEAEEILNQGAAVFPESASRRFFLAHFLELHGKSGEAIGWLHEALELDPENVQYREKLEVLRARAPSAGGR